ncbi:MAG: DUF4276 family protein [Bryobacteraceae bacterium]
MSAALYLEGGATGPDSKELKIRCREGFRKLLQKCGYENQRRMPRLIACGSRQAAFEDFQAAVRIAGPADYVALWIDSEDPLANPEASWDHLRARDNWQRPLGVTDDQVLFMTTCMETLIVADRTALTEHFGAKLQTTALPPLVDLENRHRHDVQDGLVRATRNCKNVYEKGKRSFEVLAKLSPEALAAHLPSFVRARRILNQKLNPR